MKLFNRALIYLTLIAVALVTLVPFAYLFSSSIKTKDVYFSSPFLPTSGLFEIEPSTGDLSLVDTTHLSAEPEQTFELNVEAYQTTDQQVADSTALNITVTLLGEDRVTLDTPEPDGVHQVKVGGQWYQLEQRGLDGQPIGTIRDLLAAAPSGKTSPPVQYRIASGNQHGTLGIAWGQLTTDNYTQLTTGLEPSFLRYALNSSLYASVSAVLATLFSAMGGFALAKYKFRGGKLITDMVLGSLIIPGAVMLAPMYQLIFNLNLLDSYAGLILPGVAPAFGVFLFRQAMRTSVPDEMLEAARIDGCNDLKIFFVIALPLVRPMIGAFLLITYLASWNNFIWPQIILHSPEKMPLAVGVAQLKDVYATDYGMLMAGTMVSILPVLLLFLMLQKEFIAGLTAGAVKG